MSKWSKINSYKQREADAAEVRDSIARLKEWRTNNTVKFPEVSVQETSIVPYEPPVVHLQWEKDVKSGPYVPVTPKETPKPRNRDGWGKPRARFPFGFFIPTPADEITNGFINVVNNIPGVAKEVQHRVFNTNMLMGLPIYKQWGFKPWTSRYGEIVLQDTRQTGQAVTPGKFSGLTLGPGTYVSYYDSYQVLPSYVWRGDEQVTLGPIPAGYKLPVALRGVAPSGGWGVLPTDMVSTWSYPARSNPWPQGTVATYTDGRSKPPPPKRPDVLKWVPRRPPGPNVKERKLRGNRGLFALMHFLNSVTEWNDLANSFYDALPENRKQPRASEAKKKQLLYQYWQEVDLTSALVNAALNQLTDMIWSQLGLDTKHLNMQYGQAMGANKVLSEAFGPQWKDVVDQVESLARKQFTEITGHEIRH